MNFVSHGQGGDSAVVVEVARSAGINASINATLRMNASSTVAICEAHAGIETGLLLNAAVGGQGECRFFVRYVKYVATRQVR